MTGLYDSPRWDVRPHDPGVEARLIAEVGCAPLVARVLAARGMSDPCAVRDFLLPSLDRDWQDPALIPGLTEVADRVERAIVNHERIAIFGDFDVDGMTAASLLTLALRHLGAQVRSYIPNRFNEGYGLSIVALDRIIEDCAPNLVVTVDNGISAASEVSWLLAQGIDVAITDHHEPGELVPQGVPVADPKLSNECSSCELAGAGVALKLVCELGKRMGDPSLWRRFTDLAALGTISDMMLLEGENRSLVADGVSRMRHSARPGICALAHVAHVDLEQLTSEELPFSLIPRLNAAGRMGESDVAFDLLLSDDGDEAQELAQRLEEINSHRREIESELTEEAMTLVESTYEDEKVIVVAGEGWHEGVKGIVASRLVNRFHVPVLLFSVSEGVAKGSGRTVGTVDLFHVVEQCQDLLMRFGGHESAVGVTLEAANITAFRERMEDILSQYPEEAFASRGEVSAIVDLDEISITSVNALEILQPFGQGNRKPMLATTGITMRNASRVGSNANHLRFFATNGSTSLPAIMFNADNIERLCNYDGAVDVVYEPQVETWQGRTKVQLLVRDIIVRSAACVQLPQAQSSLIDNLFAQVPHIFSRTEYHRLAESQRFITKAIGTKDAARQNVIAKLVDGEALIVERQLNEPSNPNAIVFKRGTGEVVGFVRRDVAHALAPVIDAGTHYIAHVAEVGTSTDGVLSLRVRMERIGATGSIGSKEFNASLNQREYLASLSKDELTRELTGQLIGDAAMLPAQEAALAVLAAHRNCLCVMATGRGKSLIFYVHAAQAALLNNQASVFVFPLRALVTDQSHHLVESFGELGLRVRTVTGESPQDAREAIMCELRSGEVDILLTTPEYLVIHADRFAESGRVGFVVIDEAHHAGLATSSNRSAYLSMPEVLTKLGNPLVLAVTATAQTEAAIVICKLLHIEHDDVIVDPSVRSNLLMHDKRESRDREAALVSIVASGDKTVVYVNSREQTVVLARFLRHAIPDLGQKIAFYNAGLSRADRGKVERAFRSGTLSCIVSTSAFGEGVNLPDIRHVVLYHMPFDIVEFNQMSGRAGRDNKPATVHLLFGARDARINEHILTSTAPSRSELATLYRTLMTLWRSNCEFTKEQSFSMANADIAEAAKGVDPATKVNEGTVSCGIAIFRDLKLLETSGYGSSRRIRMISAPEHVELTSSVRYLEGLRLCTEFDDFRTWALATSADAMLRQVNRPIIPEFGRLVGGG